MSCQIMSDYCTRLQCSTVQCSAVQCGAVQIGEVQHNLVQYNTMQCSAVQCNTAQCSTVQCTSTQHNCRSWRNVGCKGLRCVRCIDKYVFHTSRDEEEIDGRILYERYVDTSAILRFLYPLRLQPKFQVVPKWIVWNSIWSLAHTHDTLHQSQDRQ